MQVASGLGAPRSRLVVGPRDAALRAAGLPHEVVTFPGVDHAFFNDTGGRYNRAAADAAYKRVLAWFKRYVG